MYLNFSLTKILIFYIFFQSYQIPNELNLVAAIKSPIVNTQEDLLVKLSLNNLSNKQVLIPKSIDFDYMSTCDEGFCFTAEKKVGEKYSKMEQTANIDMIPAFDSLGNPLADKYDTLFIGKSYSRQFNITGYYHFTKGKYRIRFSFQIPKKNNLPMKSIYSNWVYFEVKRKYIDFHL